MPLRLQLRVGFGLCLVSVLAGQQSSECSQTFRPLGYNELYPISSGRGSPPYISRLHLTELDVTTPLCEGAHDVVAVTMYAPVVGNISTDDFNVTVCPISAWSQIDNGDDYVGQTWSGVGCEEHRPQCAHILAADDQPDEQRTVLLFGEFYQLDADGEVEYVPRGVDIDSITVVVDGMRPLLYGNDSLRSWTSGDPFRM